MIHMCTSYLQRADQSKSLVFPLHIEVFFFPYTFYDAKLVTCMWNVKFFSFILAEAWGTVTGAEAVTGIGHRYWRSQAQSDEKLQTEQKECIVKWRRRHPFAKARWLIKERKKEEKSFWAFELTEFCCSFLQVNRAYICTYLRATSNHDTHGNAWCHIYGCEGSYTLS